VNTNRRILAGICFALVAFVLVVLAAGCASVGTEYHSVRFDPPGSTNIAQVIHGKLYRRGLGVKSSIPQFRIGPEGQAIIETSGSLETSGDSAYLKAALQGIVNGIK
jgi:hypothetical protein